MKRAYLLFAIFLQFILPSIAQDFVVDRCFLGPERDRLLQQKDIPGGGKLLLIRLEKEVSISWDSAYYFEDHLVRLDENDQTVWHTIVDSFYYRSDFGNVNGYFFLTAFDELILTHIKSYLKDDNFYNDLYYETYDLNGQIVHSRTNIYDSVYYANIQDNWPAGPGGIIHVNSSGPGNYVFYKKISGLGPDGSEDFVSTYNIFAYDSISQSTMDYDDFTDPEYAGLNFWSYLNRKNIFALDTFTCIFTTASTFHGTFPIFQFFNRSGDYISHAVIDTASDNELYPLILTSMQAYGAGLVLFINNYDPNTLINNKNRVLKVNALNGEVTLLKDDTSGRRLLTVLSMDNWDPSPYSFPDLLASRQAMYAYKQNASASDSVYDILKMDADTLKKIASVHVPGAVPESFHIRMLDERYVLGEFYDNYDGSLRYYVIIDIEHEEILATFHFQPPVNYIKYLPGNRLISIYTEDYEFFFYNLEGQEVYNTEGNVYFFYIEDIWDAPDKSIYVMMENYFGICHPGSQDIVIYKRTGFPTAVDNQPREDISVKAYPNPAKDRVIFDLQQMDGENVQLLIFDLSGKLLKEISSRQQQELIDVGDLSAGTYLVAISGGKGIFTQKIMIFK